jgi:hypothetical protein
MQPPGRSQPVLNGIQRPLRRTRQAPQAARKPQAALTAQAALTMQAALTRQAALTVQAAALTRQAALTVQLVWLPRLLQALRVSRNRPGSGRRRNPRSPWW